MRARSQSHTILVFKRHRTRLKLDKNTQELLMFGGQMFCRRGNDYFLFFPVLFSKPFGKNWLPLAVCERKEKKRDAKHFRPCRLSRLIVENLVWLTKSDFEIQIVFATVLVILIKV